MTNECMALADLFTFWSLTNMTPSVYGDGSLLSATTETGRMFFWAWNDFKGMFCILREVSA